MSKDKKIIEQVVEQSESVLEKGYDDLVHPSAKSLGNTLSFLPRTIGVWLGKWEKWIINGEESIKLTMEAMSEKVSKIPEEKLTEPEPYVAVPAIQQLSYCYNSEELREMYANLLVSSMNIDTKWNVHPSFVDIIRQLTPDEAKLLKYLSSHPEQPMIDVRHHLANDGGYIEVIRGFTNISEGICDNVNGIYAYLDNFERLKFIEIPEGVYLSDDMLYTPLENHPLIKQVMNRALPEGERMEIRKKKFYVSTFGKEFMKTCL